MAQKMGCDVPGWEDAYLSDYHAMAAASEPAAPLPFEDEDAMAE